jgi:hypothetical protein
MMMMIMELMEWKMCTHNKVVFPALSRPSSKMEADFRRNPNRYNRRQSQSNNAICSSPAGSVFSRKESLSSVNRGNAARIFSRKATIVDFVFFVILKTFWARVNFW